MPSLTQLQTETFPLTVMDGADPLIFQIRKNSKTRSAREKLNAALDTIRQDAQKLQAETVKLQGQMAQLSEAEPLAAKLEELRAAEDADRDRIEKELSALTAKVTKAQPKIDAIETRLTEIDEQADRTAAQSLAEQLVFYVASTNMRESDAPDSQMVPVTAEFFTENFDIETLLDFARQVGASLSGPLVTRGASGNSSVG